MHAASSRRNDLAAEAVRGTCATKRKEQMNTNLQDEVREKSHHVHMKNETNRERMWKDLRSSPLEHAHPLKVAPPFDLDDRQAVFPG